MKGSRPAAIIYGPVDNMVAGPFLALVDMMGNGAASHLNAALNSMGSSIVVRPCCGLDTSEIDRELAWWHENYPHG